MNKIVPLINIDLVQDYKNAGVDAVLMGSVLSSTRQNKTYTLEEMNDVNKEIEVIAIFNRFYFEPEIDNILNEMKILKEYGIKKIICTDLGIVNLNRKYNLGFYIILDTDTTMTNHFDIEVYLNNGVNEVMVGRELTLEERLYLGDKCDSLGMHGFGYQIMSFSRRNHLSAYKTFTGLDLDTDKTYWLKEQKREDLYMMMEDDYGTHVFAPHIFSIVHCYDQIKNKGYKSIILEPKNIDIDIILNIVKDIDTIDDYQAYENKLRDDYKLDIDTGLLYLKTNQGGKAA